MDLEASLKKTAARGAELELLLMSPEAYSDTKKLKTINQEYDAVKQCRMIGEKYRGVVQAREEAEKTAVEETDPEMQQMAKDELTRLAADEETLKTELEAA